MKVAFLHPFLYRYARGIERYCVNLASALVAQDTEVEILTWKWRPALAWPELDPRVRIRSFPISRYFTASLVWPLCLFQLLRTPYDHLYIHFADFGEAPALRWLQRLRPGARFSVVLHFPYSQVPHRYHSLQKTGLAGQASSIIAVSRFVAQEAEVFFQRDCPVIPHGVNARRFTSDPAGKDHARAQLGIDPQAPVLLTVAALEERKGIDKVLNALVSLKTRLPGLVYLVAGSGSDLERLQKLAHDLGVWDMVRWIPATPDVVSYYRAADLFLILATGEASSMVTLEAMACAIPVIVLGIPPFDEMVTAEWGQLIDEPAELAPAVERLLSDPDLRSNMGQAGRRHILLEHTWEMVASRYRAAILQAKDLAGSV